MHTRYNGAVTPLGGEDRRQLVRRGKLQLPVFLVKVFTQTVRRALRAYLSVYTDTTSHNKEPKPAVAVLRVFPSCITDPPEHNAEYLWVNGSADGQS
ncbi:hypothetical protein MHYP_G00139890 [Metynnis hypsauchen]